MSTSTMAQYRSWSAVPDHLASKSRIERDLGLSVRGALVVAQVYQMTNHRWINLYDTRTAKPKKRLSKAQHAALAAGRHQRIFAPCGCCGADIPREDPRNILHEYPGWCDRCADRERRRTVCAQARTWWQLPNLVFLDTETTGLEREDEIIEIAVLDRTGTVLFESLVQPTQPIHPDAQATHHLTTMQLQTAPRLPAIAETLTRCLQGRMVVMYNADFDTRLLQQSFTRYNLTLPKAQSLCLMHLYADFAGDGVRGDYRWIKLNTACQWHNITVDGPVHRAGADAERCRQLLACLAVLEIEHPNKL